MLRIKSFFIPFLFTLFILPACGGSSGNNASDDEKTGKDSSQVQKKKDDKEKEKKNEHPQLSIGSSLPMKEHKMKGIDGSQHSLKGLAGKNGLMVIFTCNTCPFVKAWDDRYVPVKEMAKKQGVNTVLLNPNTMKRDKGDSFEDMKEFAKANHPGIPYLLDKKNKVADAFGAKTTPHVFLFDKGMKLVYRGKIDDNYKSADKVEEFYVKDALMAMKKGNEVKPATTEPKGCGIKRP